MKILSSSQIRAVDAYTIEHEPISSIDLMERAAEACVDWINNNFFGCRKIAVFAGPGNNGGDGLAIARMLHEMKYEVSVYMLTESGCLLPDALINYQRLRDIIVLTEDTMPELTPPTVVIDALFGTGLSRPLDGLAAKTASHINNSKCIVVSIDMPSGLFCEDNTDNNPFGIIYACYTLTFQQPKLSFFFAENEDYFGKLEILDIGISAEAIENQESKYFVLEQEDISGYIQPRKKFAHKGDFGHACIVAGSSGMMGSCVLASEACLRSGAGLVTARIPKSERLIVQTAVPEAIVSCYGSDCKDNYFFYQFDDTRMYSAIGIGPGIGKRPDKKLALTILFYGNKEDSYFSGKLVLDADALNIISEKEEMVKDLPHNTIITPHPKEFDRLFGISENGYQRHLKQIEMAQKYSVFIVLKGAHTSIATPDGYCFFNITGNPGMATPGSGDVLTGIIVSLLAQGLSPFQAACAGVWLHGQAGDFAARKKGQQALIARDIIKNIGKTFVKLNNKLSIEKNINN